MPRSTLSSRGSRARARADSHPQPPRVRQQVHVTAPLRTPRRGAARPGPSSTISLPAPTGTPPQRNDLLVAGAVHHRPPPAAGAGLHLLKHWLSSPRSRSGHGDRPPHGARHQTRRTLPGETACTTIRHGVDAVYLRRRPGWRNPAPASRIPNTAAPGQRPTPTARHGLATTTRRNCSTWPARAGRCAHQRRNRTIACAYAFVVDSAPSRPNR